VNDRREERLVRTVRPFFSSIIHLPRAWLRQAASRYPRNPR
jgi:hypothetical protein